MEVDEAVEFVNKYAVEKYDEKEADYPVMAGMYQFVVPAPGGAQGRIDREGLVTWASRRFETEISLDDLKNKQRDEIRVLPCREESRHPKQRPSRQSKTCRVKSQSFMRTGGIPLASANGSAAIRLSDWFKKELDYDLPMDKVESLDREALEQTLEAIVENHYHPEMRRMERDVLLSVVDAGWKDHLLAMDYLRSAVGQRGMAQLDPKGRIQTRRYADVRWTLGLHRQTGNRTNLPNGASQRGLCQ